MGGVGQTRQCGFMDGAAPDELGRCAAAKQTQQLKLSVASGSPDAPNFNVNKTKMPENDGMILLGFSLEDQIERGFCLCLTPGITGRASGTGRSL